MAGGGTPAASAAMRATSALLIIFSEIRYRSPTRPFSAARIIARAASSTPTASSSILVMTNGIFPNAAPAMIAPCGVRPQSPPP